MPANILRDEPHAATHEERARAFGCIELVSREREQITTELLNINGHAPRRLNGICVKAQVTISFLTRFANERADLCNRLNRADLIVREHQGNEYRIGSQR